MGCTHSCGKQSVAPIQDLKRAPSSIEEPKTIPTRQPTSSIGLWPYFESPDNSYETPREELEGFTCRSGHSLYKADENLYVNNKYTCDLCGQDYNAEQDPSAHCENCKFDVCPKCFQDQPDIHYACISGHRLFRVTNLLVFNQGEGDGTNNYECNVCGNRFDAGREPTYHCSHCRFDICNTCFRREQIMLRKCPVGHHLFRVRDLQRFHKGMGFYTNDYTCNVCRRKLDAGENPTSHCPACLFDICQDCMQSDKNHL